MRIFILLAHPRGQSFCSGLADAYEAAARVAGHEVRRQNLGDLVFDPRLVDTDLAQPLEPDLAATQENIAWCQYWVIVYPVWWGSVPGLFKGYLDRVLAPGFAYRPHENDPFWDKLLSGRSAQVITTSDAPALWLRLKYWNSDINMMRAAVLNYCGIKPVRLTRVDRVKFLSASQRDAALRRMAAMVPTRN